MSLAGVTSTQNLNHSIPPEACGSTTHEAPLTKTEFWNAVRLQFKYLSDVFLQIQKNEGCIAINGRLIIECKNEKFVNCKEALLAAHDGVEIRSKQLKNRGFIFSKGSDLEATTDLILRTSAIDNRGGIIESTEGAIRWISGRHAVLNNDKGTIFGKTGIVHRTGSKASTKPSKTSFILLTNRKGKFTSEGLIDLEIPYIDNTDGTVKGHIEKMRTGTFLNRYGRLLIEGNAELTVDVCFDNEFGIIEAFGGLIFHDGIWQNGGGVISAPCGLNASVKEFSDTGKGLIFSSCGEVKILTESDQRQNGKVEAALGILLLTEKGVFWGKDGHLLTPQHLEIKSEQGKVELPEATVQARTFDLLAQGQVDMSRMKIGVRQGVTVASRTQWIDAHGIDLSEAFGTLQFNAERFFNLEQTVGSVGGTFSVRSRGVDLKDNVLFCANDLDFHVEQYKAKNTIFTLSSDRFTVEAGRSIYTESSHIDAPEGAIVESSKGWIFKNNDSARGASVRRQANEAVIDKTRDSSPKINLVGVQSLYLLDYEAETKSLEIESGGSAFFRQVTLDADLIALKVDTLWLTEAKLNFEEAKIAVEKAASLRNVELSGGTLKAEAKQGTLAVQESRSRVKRSTLKAKKGITLTKNSVQGSLELESDKHQHAANNLFSSGDFKVLARTGDVLFRHNRSVDMGAVSFEAPQGDLSANDVEMEAEILSIRSKTASLQTGRIRVRNKAELKAKQASLSGLQVEANAIDVIGESFLRLDTVELESARKTSLIGKGVAIIRNSSIAGKEKVSIVADTALIEKSGIGNSDDVTLELTERGVIDSGRIRAKDTLVKSAYAVLNDSLLKSERMLTLEGSFGFVDSVSESTRGTKVEGESLGLKNSRLSVTEGDLSISMDRETLIDSRLTAENISQTSREIASIRSVVAASNRLDRSADTLFMSKGFDSAETILLKSREQYLRDHTLQAVRKVDLCSSLLDISYSSIFGSLTAHSDRTLFADNTRIEGSDVHIDSSEDLIAPNLSITGVADVNLRAGRGLFLRNSILNVARELALTGDYIDRNDSIFSAGSLSEQTAQGLSARNSYTIVSKDAYQDSGLGMSDLTGSFMQAEGSLIRRGQHIFHENAISSAKEQIYESSELTNFGGRIFIGGGNSRIEVDRLYNDTASHIKGVGTMRIAIDGDHIEKGNYEVGTLEQTAKSLTISGNIETGGLHLHATQGDLTLNKPIKTIRGSFNAGSNIVNRSHINIQEHGSFKGRQIDNRGSIRSDGALSIDQERFKDMDNVFARNELLFHSDSSIDTHKTYSLLGSLGFISRGGYVHTHAPIDVKGDFKAQGSDIVSDNTLYAGGQGIFKTPGTLHFNRMQASFGNGLFADAKTVRNDAGHVEVHGSSHIRCEEFLNSCVVETPQPKSHGKVFGVQKTETATPYAHMPATYRFHDGLVLEASKSVINDASNFYADSLELRGHTLENRNRTHIHSYREAIGSYRNSFAGLSYGKKKTLYKEVNEEIIDGVANLQVAKVFDLQLSGPLKNTGVINADSIVGSLGSLEVGNFDRQARLPAGYSQPLESLVGDAAFRPGGDFRSRSETRLHVAGGVRNSGYIESNGPVFMRAQSLFNKRQTIEQSEQAVVHKSFGRRGMKTVKTNLLGSAEASIHGSETHISLESNGRNIGGSITAMEKTTLTGCDFSNEALSLRSLQPLKAGNVAFWKSGNGHSIRTDFHPGTIASGDKLEVSMEGSFRNMGSNVAGRGDTSVIAGSIDQKTLFSAPYKLTEKRTWDKSVDRNAITMQEGRIVSVTGNLHVESVVGGVEIEGAVGSYGGSASVISATDISFQAKSAYAENKIDAIHMTPTSVASRSTHFTSSQTSFPSFFAGDGDGVLLAKGTLQGEALQLAIEKDLKVKAKAIHFKPHEVVDRSRTSGGTAGVNFFGSKAIETISANESSKMTVESILREDRAVSSIFDLVRSKERASYAVNGLTGAVYSFGETAKFARAYNQGHLSASLGEHLGITDLEGNINPRISVRVGSFDHESIFTRNIPTRLSVGGHARFEAGIQEYHGCEISRKGKGATFVGDAISFKAAADTYTSKGSSIGMSVSVGPRGPAVGVDYSEEKAGGTSFLNESLDFGDYLNIHAGELNIQGTAIVADTTHVAAKKIKVNSLVDTSSRKQTGISCSTSGEFGFNVVDGKSERISTVAGVGARLFGTLKADELVMTGALIENMAVHAGRIDARDLHTRTTSTGFSLSADFKEIGSSVNSASLTPFGAFDFKRESEKGLTRSTLTGDVVGIDGKEVRGINRDLAKVQEKGRKKVSRTGAPLVLLDFKAIQEDLSEIKQAFNGSGRSLAVAREAAVGLTESSLTAVHAASSDRQFIAKKEKEPAVDIKSIDTQSPVNAPAEDAKTDTFTLIETIPEEVDVPQKDLSLWDIVERNDRMDRMTEARMVAQVLEWGAYPLEKAIELTGKGAKAICTSHPTLEKGCRKVVVETKEVYRKSKAFVVDHIPDTWKENVAHMLKIREESLVEAAVSDEVKYRIPSERTFRFYEDCQNNTLSLATLGLFNAFGTAVRSAAGKTLVRPKVQVLHTKESKQSQAVAKASLQPVDPRSIMSTGKLRLTLDRKPVMRRPQEKVGKNQESAIDAAIAALALDKHKFSQASLFCESSKVSTVSSTVRDRKIVQMSEKSDRDFSPKTSKATFREVHDRRIAKEQALVKELSNLIIPIKHFRSPPSFTEFLAKCEAHSFRITVPRAGKLRDARMKGQLLYMPVDRGAVFLIKDALAGVVDNPNIARRKLIESVYLGSDERVGHMVNEVLKFSSSQEYKRIFVMWEPAANPVASHLINDFKLIGGLNSVSHPATTKQYVLAEINISHPAAEGAARLLKKKLESMPNPHAEMPKPPKITTLLHDTSETAGKIAKEPGPLDSCSVLERIEVNPAQGKLTSLSKTLLRMLRFQKPDGS